jgi:predicted Zn-dependent peptidase
MKTSLGRASFASLLLSVACGAPQRTYHPNQPSAAAPAEALKPKAPRAPSTAKAPPPLELPAARAEIAATAERQAPAPELLRSAARPVIETAPLRSGARAVIATIPGHPTVHIDVIGTRGAWDIDDDALVASEILESVMLSAPIARTQRTLGDDATSLGGTTFVDFQPDHVRVHVQTAAPLVADAALALVDHALRPSISDAVVADARQKVIRRWNEPTLAEEIAAVRALRGDKDPVAIVGSKTIDLGRVDTKRLTALHARLFDRRNITFVVVGGVSKTDAVAALERAVGTWPIASERELKPKPHPRTLPEKAVVIMDAPQRSNVRAIVAASAPPQSLPNGAALEVLDAHLELTVKGLSSNVWLERAADRLTVTSSGGRETVMRAVRAAVAELDRVRSKNLTDAEMARAKKRARMSVENQLASPANVTQTISVALVRGEAPTRLASLADAIDRLTPDDLRRAVATALPASSLRVFAAGDFGALRGDLVALGLGEPARYGAASNGAAAPSATPASPSAASATAATPPAPMPPDESALREAQAREREDAERERADREEAQRTRDERAEQRRREEADEDRRYQEQVAQERQEADRRFQEQMQQLQEDLQRQMAQQRGQSAAVLDRIRAQQQQQREAAQRQRDDAQRRLADQQRERERQRADRDRRDREQREADEQRRREREQQDADARRQREREQREADDRRRVATQPSGGTTGDRRGGEIHARGEASGLECYRKEAAYNTCSERCRDSCVDSATKCQDACPKDKSRERCRDACWNRIEPCGKSCRTRCPPKCEYKGGPGTASGAL